MPVKVDGNSTGNYDYGYALAKEYDKSGAFRYIILPVKRESLDKVVNIILEEDLF